MFVYFGTYTETLPHVDGKAKGIVIADLDTETGELQVIDDSCEIRNPSFLCCSRDGRFLYSIGEIKDFGEKADGAVSVFQVDSTSGSLKQLQQHSSAGIGPAYISIDRAGKFLLNANYLAGNVSVFPINADGTLGDVVSVIRHQGASVNPGRQEAPHPHCIIPSPDNRHIYVPDLGIDHIIGYDFDAASGALSYSADATTKTAPGSGPRHLAFHPSATFAFLIQELSSTITVYRFESATGVLTEIQTASTLPADYQGESYCAEIRVSTCGRFVYGSNRGHDSIAAFAFDEATGELELMAHYSTKGLFPRNFALAPDGRFLLAANQNSDTVVTFAVNEDGSLSETPYIASIPTPVHILFLPDRGTD